MPRIFPIANEGTLCDVWVLLCRYDGLVNQVLCTYLILTSHCRVGIYLIEVLTRADTEDCKQREPTDEAIHLIHDQYL